MDLGLTGKRAFVSGSTQGIGWAVADALVREGAVVLLNGRSDDRVREAARRLRAAHPQAEISGIAADFERADDVARLLEELGDVDILVNNVGLFGVAAFDTVSDDEWQRYFEVNLMSAVRLSRHLMPGMLARGDGRILMIGSESGVDVPADMLHYGTMKAALLGFANGLAKLTRGSAVTVNTILGGPTYSDGVAQVVEEISRAQGVPAEEMKAGIIAQNRTTLLERFIEPAELAALAVYLVSPRASATNGSAVRADGGVLTGML